MNSLSGRKARRHGEFGPERKRKGAGWTRKFRKGRVQRLPFNQKTEEEA